MPLARLPESGRNRPPAKALPVPRHAFLAALGSSAQMLPEPYQAGHSQARLTRLPHIEQRTAHCTAATIASRPPPASPAARHKAPAA
jgi:hypothetical protein